MNYITMKMLIMLDLKTIKNKVRVASLARADPEEAKPIHEKANAPQAENLKCLEYSGKSKS
jgi:hypothetical protein